jgi:copper transport protein
MDVRLRVHQYIPLAIYLHGQRYARQWLLSLLCALACALLPISAGTTYAHAVLVKSDPIANAVLAESPAEIRLWFTEPLEPAYSSFQLRDAMGALVSTPPSVVDAADDHQLVMAPGELPDGLYTVTWRNVSSADGHGMAGSFPFTIGAAGTVAVSANTTPVELMPLDVLVRWVNLLGLALAVGGLAFIVFVWQPALRELTHLTTSVTFSVTSSKPYSPLWNVAWLGWWMAGIGGVLLLANQTAILLNEPFAPALEVSKMTGVLSGTRFGTLWLARMALWGVMGALLLGARRSTGLAWSATACGLLMLLPTSLHSHAAVSNDLRLSIFSDWVHLVMTSLWVGGLVQFLVAIPLLRTLIQPVALKLGSLTAYFSNYARITVAGLIVTGLYATWHQVNTFEALTTTFYGQLLSLKLLLALLLLVIAGVNLVWTQRRLLAGEMVWVGRLRGLVSLEVLLLLGILLIVGTMTAVNPARNEIAQREAAAAIPPAPQVQPFHTIEIAEDLHIHLTITPGWVGNNRFMVQLFDENEEPVVDARLIRLRFEHQHENLGESELQIRPEAEAPDGLYLIDGSNLSTAGEWRLRMTVQRPDAFDTIADFPILVNPPPAPPPPPPVVDLNPVLPYRTPVLLLVGLSGLLLGALFLVQQRFRIWQGPGLLASLLTLFGVVFLLTAIFT